MKITKLTLLFLLFCFQAISQYPINYEKIKLNILQADTIYFDLNEVGCFTSEYEKILITTKDYKKYVVIYTNIDKKSCNTSINQSKVSAFINMLIKEIKRKRECDFVFTTIIRVSGKGENIQYLYGCHEEKKPFPRRLKRKLKIPN